MHIMMMMIIIIIIKICRNMPSTLHEDVVAFMMYRRDWSL
jgi:hypothetical protein